MKLIVGGDSITGKALSAYWDKIGIAHHSSTRRKELLSEYRPYINLEEGRWPKNLKQYDSAVLCAAIAGLSDCEGNPRTSRQINVVNTTKISFDLNNSSCYVLFLSSNQVFDGSLPFRKTDDLVSPINEYGKQKAETERNLSQIPNTTILRLTKIVYQEMGLIQNWKRDLTNGKTIFPFNDMTLSPVWLDDLTQAVSSLCICEPKKTGILHLSGDSDKSYYDFACELFANSLETPQKIIPSSYKNSKSVNVKIPRFTSLDMK